MTAGQIIPCSVMVGEDRTSHRLRQCGKPSLEGFHVCADHFPNMEDIISSHLPDAEHFASIDDFFKYVCNGTDGRTDE